MEIGHPFNPQPGLSTATEGMNEPGVPLDEWSLEMLEDVRPAERERVSKHRAGRQPKKTEGARRRERQAHRLAMRAQMDAKALSNV